MLDVIGDLRPRLSRLVNDTFVAVILFGSLARCEADSRSDVDILVLHKNLGRIDRVRRRRAVYLAVSALPRDYPLTVINVDVDEFRASSLRCCSTYTGTPWFSREVL